jgi:outer membrane protein TolC
VAVAVNRLRRLTGAEPSWLRALDENFQPVPLVPTALQDWIETAIEQSPSLQARRQTIDVARANVQRNKAGHLPRVDLVASLSRVSNDSISNLNQSSKLASAGFQISVPLFSGGSVVASVRQAESDQSRVEEEARSERENLELEVQRLYLGAVHGVERIDAQRKVVDANQTALQGVARALDAGLATTADVLEARSRVFAAQRDLAQARYEYLVARMRLMATSGFAMQRVVDDLDQMLTMKTELPPRRAP